MFEKFGFDEKLLWDNCSSLLELGDVVYPRFVGLFYANLEIKSSANGVFFETLVKSVRITLSRPVLATIFGLSNSLTRPRLI